MTTSVKRLITVVVVLGVVSIGCGSSKGRSSSSSTSADTAPATTSAPTTATPTTSTLPTTTSAPTTVQPATAVWPFASSGIRYHDPVAAAKGFAVTYLGFVNPAVGAFQQGDNRSGEVTVRTSNTGPVTTVLVRQLTPGDTWWVLGATTPNLQLTTPTTLAAITSPVTVSGRSTAFEAVVNIEVRQDGTLTPLAATTAMGGSNGQMGPFSKSVSFASPVAPRGAIIVKTISAKNGTTAEATVIRVLLS
jgi:hypothetical protein